MVSLSSRLIFCMWMYLALCEFLGWQTNNCSQLAHTVLSVRYWQQLLPLLVSAVLKWKKPQRCCCYFLSRKKKKAACFPFSEIKILNSVPLTQQARCAAQKKSGATNCLQIIFNSERKFSAKPKHRLLHCFSKLNPQRHKTEQHISDTRHWDLVVTLTALLKQKVRNVK